MKKLLFVSFLVLFAFCTSNGLFSQSSLDEDNDITEEEKPQPAKKYNLTPKFAKDMEWTEKIELSTINKRSSSVNTETFKLSGNAKVTGFKEEKPTELVISDFGGTATSERLYHRDNTTETDEEEIKNIELTFTVDDAYKLKFDLKKASGAMELLLFYPSGNLLGFEVPQKAVAIGEKWSSKTLAPLNFHIVEDLGEKVSVNITTSEFKLVSVKTKDKVEIASISWTGSCTVDEGRGEEEATVKWKRTIEFDISNSRVLSTTGSFSVDIPDEEESMEFKSTRNLEYKKIEAKDEEPKIKPKSDDE